MQNPCRQLDPTELSYLLEARIRGENSPQAALAAALASTPLDEASRLADIYATQMLPARLRRSR